MLAANVHSRCQFLGLILDFKPLKGKLSGGFKHLSVYSVLCDIFTPDQPSVLTTVCAGNRTHQLLFEKSLWAAEALISWSKVEAGSIYT